MVYKLPEAKRGAQELNPIERVEESSRGVTEHVVHTITNLSQLDMPTAKQRLLDFLLSPITFFKDFGGLLDSFPDRNYELAREMLEGEHYVDALLRLKFALWFRPNFQMAHYLRGLTYLAMQKEEDAVKSLKKSLELNPRHDESVYILATIDPKYVPVGMMPKRMPDSMVRDYFDGAAEGYDEAQQVQGYAAPAYAADILERHIDTSRVNYQVLDLGCGTGLAAEVVTGIALSITGVDFAREMTHNAMQRQRRGDGLVYDRVLLREMNEYLASVDGAQYDIVLAVNSVSYQGDLSELFKGVAHILHDNGYFLIQLEVLAGTGYAVQKSTGRFAHAESYVVEQARVHGFKLMASEDFMAYPDLKMKQYLLQKSA